MHGRSDPKKAHRNHSAPTVLTGKGGTGSSPRRRLIVLMAIAVGLTLFAHWPALSARALSIDDDQYLTGNTLVRNPSWESLRRFFSEVFSPTSIAGYYQPLTMISLMLDYAVAGDVNNLRPFHRTSLALHAANTALLILLLYMFFTNPWAAAMIGLLFGVHPMTVETIPWVGERKTLLATFFALWCLIAYVRYARSGGWTAYTACLALYALALLSKPTAVPIPVVLVLLDFWPLRRLGRRALFEKAPFFVLAGLSAVVTFISQRHQELGASGSLSAGQTFLLICHNLVFYPWHMVWPVHLSSFYAFPEDISLSNNLLLTAALITVATFAILSISLRWTRALLTGWLCFVFLLAPTLLNKSYSPCVAWDKYAYLPAAGLLLVLAWALGRLWSRVNRRAGRPLLAASVLVVAALLTVGTRGQLTHWRTTQALCDYTIAVSPRAFSFYHHRGNLRNAVGDWAAAYADYSRAIELNPDYAGAYSNRAIALASQGDHDGAIADCTRAIEIDPRFAAAYGNRALAFQSKGDWDAAIRDCTTAIELNRTDASAYNNRGTAYARKGDYDAALADFRRAVDLRPNEAAFRRNLANAYLVREEFPYAVTEYSRVIALHPTDASAYSGRAAAYCGVGQYDRAWADVQTLTRLGAEPPQEVLKILMESMPSK